MNELNQSTKIVEELTISNNAFKIVLQVTEDERNFYKAANFEEFNKFIENYIVNLFDNFNFNNQIINKIFEFMQRFNLLNNRYIVSQIRICSNLESGLILPLTLA
jgi:hypothetical protein